MFSALCRKTLISLNKSLMFFQTLEGTKRRVKKWVFYRDGWVKQKRKKICIYFCLLGGLYSLSIALSNTFVNMYLWKQSGQIVDIAVYNLTVVLFQPLTFVFAGRLAKKVDRIIVLRLGVIFLALFYLTVLLVGQGQRIFFGYLEPF